MKRKPLPSFGTLHARALSYARRTIIHVRGLAGNHRSPLNAHINTFTTPTIRTALAHCHAQTQHHAAHVHIHSLPYVTLGSPPPNPLTSPSPIRAGFVQVLGTALPLADVLDIETNGSRGYVKERVRTLPLFSQHSRPNLQTKPSTAFLKALSTTTAPLLPAGVM